ncbi:hypothetical protein H5410_001573 [Solanum commersonii]|uniref:Uncharacterized protein n=1 Tax=Solanum commersonii TaxID=4109 RepID=A0A9J6AZF3_SOLCO|nr:hypothetical protein H5410_001573 [Solanum commersonii]
MDPKVGFTEEQIPCLYKTLYITFYNNIWRIIVDGSVKHIARKISVQDEDKEAMINCYLEEVKRSLLLNITQYEKSDTSMRSETSEDTIDDIQDAQLVEATTATTSEDTLRKAKDFLQKLKEKDKL